MKFTEEKLEQTVIELFEAENYKNLSGEQIHKEMSEVLLRDDLKQYLPSWLQRFWAGLRNENKNQRGALPIAQQPKFSIFSCKRIIGEN